MKKGAQLNFQFAEDTKAKAAGAKLLQTPRPRPRGQSEAWRAQGALNTSQAVHNLVILDVVF